VSRGQGGCLVHRTVEELGHGFAVAGRIAREGLLLAAGVVCALARQPDHVHRLQGRRRGGCPSGVAVSGRDVYTAAVRHKRGRRSSESRASLRRTSLLSVLCWTTTGQCSLVCKAPPAERSQTGTVPGRSTPVAGAAVSLLSRYGTG
jgi:hypothetical protein